MDLEAIVKNLHRLNFGKDGLIEFAPDGDDYNFGKLKNGEHDLNRKLNVCRKCDGYDLVQEGGAKCVFTRITHGTHTLDFLDAHGVDHDTVAPWSQKPVLFVMENPGAVDTGTNGSDLPIEKNEPRCISKRWYWVMGQYGKPNGKFFYPQYFVQKEYGWMIYSVIRTFKMANAYVTNMVKCGMVSEEEKGKKNYLTTDEYPPKVVDTCITERLKMELECLRGRNNGENVIVFAFGERTFYHFKEALKDDLKSGKISLYLLPHPANRLANDYRKYVLFGKILRALLQNQFYKDVKEKPDFEAILAADTDEEPKESREVFCVKKLTEFSASIGMTLQKRKSYAKDEKDKSICYEFVYLKDPQGVASDEPEKLVLRQRLIPYIDYMQKERDRKFKFHVSWVEYNFRTKEIRLFAGESGTANVWIEDKDADETKFPILDIIKAFADAYQTKCESTNGPGQE